MPLLNEAAGVADATTATRDGVQGVPRDQEESRLAGPARGAPLATSRDPEDQRLHPNTPRVAGAQAGSNAPRDAEEARLAGGTR